MRTTGANDDDLKVLLSKRFLLPFENGVVVIKHWLIHNLIQKDRYHPTRFQEEKKMLLIKENKAYTESPTSVNKMLPEVRLGKVRLVGAPASESGSQSIPHSEEIRIQDEREEQEKPSPVIPRPYSATATSEAWKNGEIQYQILDWFFTKKGLWAKAMTKAKLQAFMRVHMPVAKRLAKDGWSKKELEEARVKSVFSPEMESQWVLTTIEKSLTK